MKNEELLKLLVELFLNVELGLNIRRDDHKKIISTSLGQLGLPPEIVSLVGGNKKTQKQDILKAKEYWKECTNILLNE
jgi:hypothetical protein